MEFPFVKGERLAEGVGNAPTSGNADPVFETGAASLYLPAFQNGQGGENCTPVLLVPSEAVCY
jgi:hypothetical protein